MSDAKSGSGRPKVLVSGCFDLIHSGHIEFFNEAAQHGDLYVRLGTCENIRKLKNHETTYSDEERVFFVKNIGCVADAALSKGEGVFDWEVDMKEIKPDIYFVNEDASRLEERVGICKRLGVKMVVQPRKPKEGLKVRSSTSMKSRIRDMLAAEELVRQDKGIAAFHEEIPWRLCFAGGWMDLGWCNKYASGCAITINIKFDRKICKDFCGLATSSRKVAIKLWNGRVPKYLDPMQAAKFLWGAENFTAFGDKTKPYIAGSQDHCGLMFPGVNKLCYKDGNHWPWRVVNMNDTKDPKQAKIFSWLESVISIVEIPFVSRPKNYSSQGINYLKDPNVPEQDKKELVGALADASLRAWDSIVKMDADGLGRALSDTMTAWGNMLPFTVDPYKGDPSKTAESKQLRAFWKQYDYPNTKGCLFSGAGGGFLMVISDKPVKKGIKLRSNNDPICQPWPSDKV